MAGSGRLIQSSFNAGEWSPTMDGRTDLQKYRSACSKLQNFIPTVQGSAFKRSGTRYISSAAERIDIPSDPPKLIPFEYGEEQAYVLEFGDGFIRVFTDSAPLLTGTTQTIYSHGDSVPSLIEFFVKGASISAIGKSGAGGSPAGVVTANNHGFNDGDLVYIHDVSGMTQINDDTYTAKNPTRNTFELYDTASTPAAVDSSAWGAYTTGGNAVNHGMDVGEKYLIYLDGIGGTGADLYTEQYLLATVVTEGHFSIANDPGTLGAFGEQGTFDFVVQMNNSPYVIDGSPKDAGNISWAQSADVLYLANGSEDPHKITRNISNQWTLEEIDFDWDPFLPLNTDERIVVIASDVTGDGITIESESVGGGIAGISNTKPAVVTTTTAHGLLDGDRIVLRDVGGMTEVDSTPGATPSAGDFLVRNPDAVAKTFEIEEYDDVPGTLDLADASVEIYSCTTDGTNTLTMVTGDTGKLAQLQSVYGHPDIPAGTICVSFSPPSTVVMSQAATGSSTAATTFGHNAFTTGGEVAFSVFQVGVPLVRLTEVVASEHGLWEASSPNINYGSIAVGDTRYFESNVYELTNMNAEDDTGTSPPIHEMGEKSDGKWDWEYLHSGEGYARITTLTNNSQVVADVVKRFPESVVLVSGEATSRWSLGAWGGDAPGFGVHGYPRAVTFYEDRLWWAGSFIQPQTLWASESGAYESHKLKDLDESALVLTVNTDRQNAIEWLASSQQMKAGTAGGELIVSAADTSEAIVPGNVRIVRHSSFGVKANVPPILIDQVVMFVQRQGLKIRELVFDESTQSFLAPDMTVLSEHLFQLSRINRMAFQQEPNRLLWVLMESGELFGFVYERDQQVTGWFRFVMSDTNGTAPLIHSIATVPSSVAEDRLWMVVERSGHSMSLEYVEVDWKRDDALEDAFFADGAIVYDGSPVSTITGLAHLEGEIVKVLADGTLHPDRTVADASITLDASYSKVLVGLPYEAVLQTMRLDGGDQAGSSQGKLKRITDIVLRLDQAAGGVLYGPTDTDADMDTLSLGETLKDGDTEQLDWPKGYEQDGYITIKHKDPLPCTVTAIMPNVEVTEA